MKEGFPWGTLLVGVALGSVGGDLVLKGKRSVYVQGPKHVIAELRGKRKK